MKNLINFKSVLFVFFTVLCSSKWLDSRDYDLLYWGFYNVR